MDGLAVTISNSTTIENIDKLAQLMGNWKTFHSCCLNNQVWKLVIPKSNKNISNLLTENQTCFLQLLQAHKNGSECQVFLILKKIIASRILKEKKIYSTPHCLYLVLNTQETSHFYWHQFWHKNDNENICHWNYFQLPRALSELAANWPGLTSLFGWIGWAS